MAEEHQVQVPMIGSISQYYTSMIMNGWCMKSKWTIFLLSNVIDNVEKRERYANCNRENDWKCFDFIRRIQMCTLKCEYLLKN